MTMETNSWKTKVLIFLNSFLKERTDVKDVFVKANRAEYVAAATCVQSLKDVKEYVEKYFEIDAEGILERIFMEFHKIARQFRTPHDNRKTLSIEDENDVQDLLHALLHLYFADIRAEEWTPSYAGKSARVDFLWKNERTVIFPEEIRQESADKDVGDQLIIDVDRYKEHPDCEKLIYFVYDPEGRLSNPFEKEITEMGHGCPLCSNSNATSYFLLYFIPSGGISPPKFVTFTGTNFPFTLFCGTTKA